MSRKCAVGFVERRRVAETQRLRHVDLHVIDEISVPDGLEQAVGEAEREDILRRLLAEKVVDAKDLLFVEHLVQLRVQRHRARQVGAERLLHDDRASARRGSPRRASARPTGPRSAERSGSAGDGSRRRTSFRPSRRRPSARRRRPSTARSPGLRERGPVRVVDLSRRELVDAPRATLRKPSASRSSSETPMIRQPGMNPALERWNSPGSSLRSRDRPWRRRARRLGEISDLPLEEPSSCITPCAG